MSSSCVARKFSFSSWLGTIYFSNSVTTAFKAIDTEISFSSVPCILPAVKNLRLRFFYSYWIKRRIYLDFYRILLMAFTILLAAVNVTADFNSFTKIYKNIFIFLILRKTPTIPTGVVVTISEINARTVRPIFWRFKSLFQNTFYVQWFCSMKQKNF